MLLDSYNDGVAPSGNRELADEYSCIGGFLLGLTIEVFSFHANYVRFSVRENYQTHFKEGADTFHRTLRGPSASFLRRTEDDGASLSLNENDAIARQGASSKNRAGGTPMRGNMYKPCDHRPSEGVNARACVRASCCPDAGFRTSMHASMPLLASFVLFHSHKCVPSCAPLCSFTIARSCRIVERTERSHMVLESEEGTGSMSRRRDSMECCCCSHSFT